MLLVVFAIMGGALKALYGLGVDETNEEGVDKEAYASEEIVVGVFEYLVFSVDESPLGADCMEYMYEDASRLAFLDEFVEGASCGVVPEDGSFENGGVLLFWGVFL